MAGIFLPTAPGRVACTVARVYRPRPPNFAAREFETLTRVTDSVVPLQFQRPQFPREQGWVLHTIVIPSILTTTFSTSRINPRDELGPRDEHRHREAPLEIGISIGRVDH